MNPVAKDESKVTAPTAGVLDVTAPIRGNVAATCWRTLLTARTPEVQQVKDALDDSS